MATTQPTPEDLRNLRIGLVETFDMAGLQLLCADMGINFQNIPGDTIAIKAFELVEYHKHRGKLGLLLEKVKRERPDYPWPEIGTNISRVSPQPAPDRKRIILFVASNPTNEARLRTGAEFDKIKDTLQASTKRDQFELATPVLAVRTDKINVELKRVKPEIVHFSGHGDYQGLRFEGQEGLSEPVDPEVLADLFKQNAKWIKCVVLNACLSEPQARAIARHIDSVIGMDKEIGDDAAEAFSVGFYQALGEGDTIEEAFMAARSQIAIRGIEGRLIPVLIPREGVNLNMPDF